MGDVLRVVGKKTVFFVPLSGGCRLASGKPGPE